MKARNPKLEGRNKCNDRTAQISNEPKSIRSFGFSEFETFLGGVCFGFRASDLGFASCRAKDADH
jgi:hypothetical protein